MWKWMNTLLRVYDNNQLILSSYAIVRKSTPIQTLTHCKWKPILVNINHRGKGGGGGGISKKYKWIKDWFESTYKQ